MNKLVLTVPAFVVAVFSAAPATADLTGSTQLTQAQQQCYGMAMIGMDSVINSRLGVPPEHAVELTRVSGSGADAQYDYPMLNVMLAAYLWKGTPHAYAMNVFYNCAQDNVSRDNVPQHDVSQDNVSARRHPPRPDSTPAQRQQPAPAG